MAILLANCDSLEDDDAMCPDEAYDGISPLEHAENEEVLSSIREAIESLEPRLRTTARLRAEGKFILEIAAMMSVTRETVRNRLIDVAERVRAKLDKRFGSRENWRGFALAPLLSPKPHEPKLHPSPTLADAAKFVATAATTAAILVPLIIVFVAVLAPEPEAPECRTPTRIEAAATAQMTVPGRAEPVARIEPKAPDKQPRKSKTPPAAPAKVPITGQVLDPWGSPMDGIWVRADGKLSTMTDRDGRYRLEVDPGKHRVEVWTIKSLGGRDWSRYWTPGKAKLAEQAVRAGDTADFRLDFAASVSGRFQGAETGSALSMIVLPHIFTKRGYSEHFPGLRSVNGEFVILFRKVEPMRIAFKPVGANFLRCEPQDLKPEAGAKQGMLFEFSRGGVIFGTVRHESGRPIKQVEIHVRDEETDRSLGTGLFWGKRFRETGEYELVGLPAGRALLKATIPGYPEIRMRGVDVSLGSRARSDLVIRDGGHLEIVAKDRRGGLFPKFTAAVKSLVSAEPYQKLFEHNEGAREISPAQPGTALRILLLPGRYAAEIVAGGKKYSRVCEVVAGKTCRIEVRAE